MQSRKSAPPRPIQYSAKKKKVHDRDFDSSDEYNISPPKKGRHSEATPGRGEAKKVKPEPGRASTRTPQTKRQANKIKPLTKQASGWDEEDDEQGEEEEADEAEEEETIEDGGEEEEGEETVEDQKSYGIKPNAALTQSSPASQGSADCINSSFQADEQLCPGSCPGYPGEAHE